MVVVICFLFRETRGGDSVPKLFRCFATAGFLRASVLHTVESDISSYMQQSLNLKKDIASLRL